MSIKKRAVISLTAALAILTPLLIWDNIRLETVHCNITDKRLPEAFNGFKIVQVSDLHNNLFGENQQRLLKKIKEENPDIIAITGDLIDSEETDNSYIFIKEAVKIAPCYYVMGNHEKKIKTFYESTFRPLLKEAGVNVLEGEWAYIARGNDMLPIFGAMDFLYDSHEMFIHLHGRFKEDEFVLLLSHRPEHIWSYSECKASLVLTGHAHGGQMRFPFTHRGVYAPGQGFFPKYTEGVFKRGNTQMVVSRGLANNVWPIPRVNNCYQLVSITLNKD